MMTPSRELEEAVKAYLADVDRHLQGMSAAERRELIGGLESHIHEALEQTAGGREPTVEDARAVLAEMDPPEAYGPGDEHTVPKWRTVAGAVGLAAALLGWAAALMLSELQNGPRVFRPGLPILLGLLCGLCLGILGWPSRFGKASVYTSLGSTVVLFLLWA